MKILVIEDDRDVCESMVNTLEDEEFIVDTAGNGPEGLYRATEWEYDVIILDLMLPELDGWQILERLRRKKIQTPVLILTALDGSEDRVNGLDRGADDYLTKPFCERELTARLRALHRRSAGHAHNVIALGHVEIDTAGRLVSLNGEPVKLTAAQYRIIAYLAARAGKIVARHDLAEAITGDEETALSNVIDVQVHHIRRKLGKDFVQSRRGLGYMIPVPEKKMSRKQEDVDVA